ncbi:MAG: MerC domain-containing protein [Aquirufa sp.]
MTIERIGIILSIVCAIHCMAMPFLLIFAPMFLSSFAYSDSMEWSLVISSFLLAAILLYFDFKKHQKPLPLVLLLIAILIKAAEYLVNINSLDWIFGILLGVSIGFAYWVNYQHKSTCTCKIKS